MLRKRPGAYLSFVFAIVFAIVLAVATSASANTGNKSDHQQDTEILNKLFYIPLNLEVSSEFAPEFDKVFTKSTLASLPMPGEPDSSTPYIWINRVFSGRTKTRVFAKGGVIVTGTFEYGRVYTNVDGSFVSHVPHAAMGDHVFFFNGISREVAEEFTGKLMRVSNTPVAANKRMPSFFRLRGASRLVSPYALAQSDSNGEPILSLIHI